MAKARIDAVDRKLLELLQRNADLQVADLAQAVGLSQTACWRRVQRLKDSGVIKGNVTLVDRRHVNVSVTVFAMVRTSTHTQAWFDRFRASVELIPEVVEFYRMSGDVDYMLRIVVPDIAAYDKVYRRLISDTQFSDVSSSFAMEELKYTTALPLSYAE